MAEPLWSCVLEGIEKRPPIGERHFSAKFLFLLFLSVDEFFEGLARFKDWKLRGRNLDRLARLRVATLASGALRDLEGAEFEERYRIVLFQCFTDGRECSREYRISLFLRRASLLGDGFDELCFLQRNPLFLKFSVSITLQRYYTTERGVVNGFVSIIYEVCLANCGRAKLILR